MTCVHSETAGKHVPAKATPWALNQLPTFPWVAARLMQMFAESDISISEIGRVIALDSVFAARVLQTANSPLFGARAEVKSISHAIILLGLRRVKAVTITRALADFVAPALKVEALRGCWQNSLAAAIIAEKLARACKLDPDFAYVAGLMRDIGRLALLLKHPDAYANLLAASHENTFDLMSKERELFEVDHCQAGAWIVQDLPFPSELREVVARHHEKPREGSFQILDLVRVADLLTDALGFAVLGPIDRQSFQEVMQLLPLAAQDRFGADPENLTAEIDSRIQAWE